MPFSVDDFEDLIRLLGQHPEWRAELRRHVLSDELLELPALVRALTEQVGALAAWVDRPAEARAAAERRLGGVEAALERLAEAQLRTETRVGRLEAEILESRYVRRAPAYFSRLARRLRVIESGVLADPLDEAVLDGRLEDAERNDVLEADLVLAGRRREDGADIFLLAEISVGVGPSDVERAARRAALLAKLGRPVTPIVAGEWISAETVALARERGVVHVPDGQIAGANSA